MKRYVVLSALLVAATCSADDVLLTKAATGGQHNSPGNGPTPVDNHESNALEKAIGFLQGRVSNEPKGAVTWA